MDFDWTAEQARARDEVTRWAQRELNEDVVSRDADNAFSREAWNRCAAFGIPGLPVAQEYCGQGADALTIAGVLEALGYGCRDNGLLFSLHAHMWSCEMPITRFGNDQQKRRYLPGLCGGSLIGGQAMTESGSGSDALRLATVAEPRGGGYVLNGAKRFITNAPVADVFVTFASTDPNLGSAGVSAFLVERDTPGLTVAGPAAKMGLRTAPMGELRFVEAEIPGDSLLGPIGAGMSVFNYVMEWERTFILATAIGSMQRLLERTIEHARQRNQFGQPIGKFQSVANRIVDMELRLETCRLLLYRAAWIKGKGRRAGLESALAKLHVSECYLQSSLDALHLHGGVGYLTEQELEREVRDAVGSRLYSGTSEIQRMLVARHLGL